MKQQIVLLTSGDTHDLRRDVLRAGTASDVVVFDDDELATTFHLGVRVDGVLVAVSSWYQRPYPDLPAEHGFQLRGMATSPDRQGSGLGSRLLAEGLARCAELGATVVWARARTTALVFYERAGFEAVGAGYVDLTTGLAHRDIVRRLGNRSASLPFRAFRDPQGDQEVHVPSRTTIPVSSHPYASALRQRAAHLRDLARSIEQSLVMTLDVAFGDTERAVPDRMLLCDAMLARNLHQLHQAADDLRYTAHRFQTRADELDAAHRARAVA